MDHQMNLFVEMIRLLASVLKLIHQELQLKQEMICNGLLKVFLISYSLLEETPIIILKPTLLSNGLLQRQKVGRSQQNHTMIFYGMKVLLEQLDN
jgi:hypothetical protein